MPLLQREECSAYSMPGHLADVRGITGIKPSHLEDAIWLLVFPRELSTVMPPASAEGIVVGAP